MAEVLAFPGTDAPIAAPISKLRAPSLRADLDAERAVLGAILLDAERRERVLARVGAIVSAEDFYDPRHALVFEAILRVAESADIDIRTVTAELRAMDRTNTVGAPQYLAELTEWIPTLAHSESHARLVAEHSAARKIADLARTLAYRASEPGAKLARLISDHVEKLRAVRLPGRASLRLADDLVGAVEEIENTTADDAWRYLRTGLVDLDEALGGGYAAGLHLVAARPSLGKTALALQLSRATCARSEPVFFLEAEMDVRSLNRISIAAMARVAYDRVQHPRGLTQDDFNACIEAVNQIDAWPFFVAARGGADLPRTVAGLRSAVTGLPVKPRVVIVDHVGKLQPRGRYSQTRDAYREISDDLIGLARDLDVPVIVLAHIGRQVAKGELCRRPRLEDLAECSALEADADSVLLLHSEAVYPTRRYKDDEAPDPSVVEMFVAKVRGAKRQQLVRARFRGEFQTFEPLFARAPESHDFTADAQRVDEEFPPMVGL